MSNLLSQPIGYGRTAEIYPWQDGKVLKLFYDFVDPVDIEYEARLARLVELTGLPVPEVGSICRVGNRVGLEYEHITGSSMRKVFNQKPWRLFRYARLTAQLQSRIHHTAAPRHLPGLHRRLSRKIERASGLPSDLRARSIEALDTMPRGNRLCHGDFHPENILMSPKGEVIIDWTDASRGNPVADLARSSITLLGAAECQIESLIEKTFVRIFHSVYLKQYFRINPGCEQEFHLWLPVVAAARVSEAIPELEEWLVMQASR